MDGETGGSRSEAKVINQRGYYADSLNGILTTNLTVLILPRPVLMCWSLNL